jgi:hypothetical protein
MPENTGRGIDGDPRHRNETAMFQNLIIIRDYDRDRRGRALLLQIHVVIEELAPRIHHAG